tara:strand:+ start:75312 stop:76052 length:741 start_codon:yes stop_codon:yes gene_type:complete
MALKKWLTTLKNYLIVLSLLGCLPIHATSKCLGFYHQKVHPFPALISKIHQFRSNLLETTDVTQLAVNGIAYKVIGKLGGDRERVKVYLCKAPNGKLVQIKRTQDNNTWPNSIFYEMAVTRYYLEHGLNVPAVIDYSVEYTDVLGSKYMTSTIVKEYFEGPTGSEIFFADDSFTSAELNHMNQRITKYRQRVAAIHRGFKNWLKVNKIDLHKTEFSRLDFLIEGGDIDAHNILYNAILDDGVIFDP